MNYLAPSGLLIFISSVFSVALVLFKAKKDEASITWILFSLFVALWGFGLYKGFSTDNYSTALFWGRFLNLSAVFIPIFFLHFTFAFTNKSSKKKPELKLYYTLIAVYFFACLFFPKLFVSTIEPKNEFIFYPVPGILYYFFPVIFSILVIYGVVILFRELLSSPPMRKNQIKYLLSGITIGFMGGSTTFFYVFGIPIPPIGTFLSMVYVITVSIAIARYRLWDITFAIGKGVTYAVSLILVSLGMWFLLEIANIIYHGLFSAKQNAVILFCTTVIYTACILLYPRVLGKIESVVATILHKNKYKYQEKLREIAGTIPTIYDMERLLKYTVDATKQVLDCSPCSIMILDDIMKSYSILYSKGLSEEVTKKQTFLPDTEIIQKLRWGNRPVVKEEFLEDDPVKEKMNSIKAEVSIPIVRKDKLLGILNLNYKASGDIYSHEDLSILSDISKYLGMAMENISYREKEHRQELVTYLNNIAYALAHELKNKAQTLRATSDVIQSMLPQLTNVPQDLLALAKIAGDKISEMDNLVNELMTYSNIQQKKGFAELDLTKIFDESLSIVEGEIKGKNISIIKNYSGIITACGDHGQLTQVFVSIIRNGIESMEEKGSLSLNISDKENFWEITIQDTGKGIPKNHLNSVFEPFFTTKHDHSGLGLSIARRIVYDHSGEIKAESKEGKGTVIYIYLPKNLPEEKAKAMAVKRREDISYDRIKTKDYQDKMKKEIKNG